MLTFGNSNLQLPPQIFYGFMVWRLAKPLLDLNALLVEPLRCCFGHVFWVIVLLEYPSRIHFQCPGWLQCPGPDGTWPHPSSLWCGAVVLSFAEKHPQSIMSPPPCLMVGMVIWSTLGSLAAFLLLQIRWVELMPKSWIFRLQTCAFLSRGTLRAPQDFSPSRRSVLPIVFLVTMVPAALRSLTRSSRVVLGWFLTVLTIIETPRGEILHGAPVRGRLIVILCFFYLQIIATAVVTFSPSCLLMVL